MSTITFKNGQPIPPKRKKRKSVIGRILVALLILVVALPLLLVGLVFGLFYDDTHTPIKYREDYPNEEIINDAITHSLDYCAVDHQVRLRITEQLINQLFYNVLYSGEDNAVGDIMKNLYVKITNKNYIFGVEVDLYGYFKTRLLLTTKLKVTDEDVIFKITDIQLGRAKGLNKLAEFIMQYIPLPDINKVFHDNGFNMELDLKKLSLTYPKENLYEDLSKSLGESDDPYLSLFTEMIFDNDFLTILPNNEKALEFNVNLENLRPNDDTYHITGYELPAGYLDTYLSNSMNKVEEYLESEVINPDHAQAVANYYVKGFDHLDESDKAIVDPYLQSHAINEATDTYNYELNSEDDLTYIAIAQLAPYGLGSTHYEAEFTTDQIDKALSQASVIGTTVLFKAKDEENNYTANFISVDRVNNVIDATCDGFMFALSINFNGYDVALSLKTTFDDEFSEFGKVKFNVENFYIGNKPLSPETKNTFMEVISSAIEDGAFSDTMSFHIDGDNSYILLDLTNILEARGVTASNGYTTEFTLLEQTATTPGKLHFVANK